MVTVHDTVVLTKFATQYVTVTAADQQAQCTQNADALQANTDSGNQYHHQQQQQQTADAQAATQTAAPQIETITSTRSYTTAYVHVSHSVLYIEAPHNDLLYRKRQ